MGFLNNKKVIKQNEFQPLELNEINVQAIFNSCLAKDTSKAVTGPILFTKTNRFFRGF